MTFTYFSDSLPVESPTYILEGIWIHDPQFPQETVVHLRISPTGRDESFSISSTPLEIVNRAHPVFDYGIHRDDEFSFTSVIPHGSEYQENVRTVQDLYQRATLLFVKDNRGRAVFGLMDQVNFTDLKQGSDFNFRMTRAYREEVTV
jgi:hypothetical protein